LTGAALTDQPIVKGIAALLRRPVANLTPARPVLAEPGQLRRTFSNAITEAVAESGARSKGRKL
jgi:hypothetical protein